MSLKVKNCCFCFLPLRPGLLIWGYAALILIYTSFVVILYQLHSIFYSTGRLDANQFITKVFALIALFMHFIFHVILVWALHKKSLGLLGVYRGYVIISMILQITAAAIYIPLAAFNIYRETRAVTYYNDDIQHITTLFKFVAIAVVILGAALIISTYLLVCVKSLISKLEDDEQCLAEQLPENPELIIYRCNDC